MNFFRFFRLVILLIIVSANLSYFAFSQEEIWSAKGDKALQSGQFDQAVEYFDKAIKLNKTNKHYFYNRGLAYLYNQKFDYAINDFDKVIELDPKYSDAYNNRGLCLNYMGLYDSAMSNFNQAIKLDPKFSEAYINRGTAFLGFGEFDKALEDFNKAIDLEKKLDKEKKNPAVFNERGRVFYFKKKFDKAISDFSKAIELGLNNSKIYYNRANAYFNLKKYDLAIKDYNKVLSIDSMNTDALNNRSLAYEKTGKNELSLADRKRLAKITGTEGRFPEFDSIKFVPYADKLGHFTLNMPDKWFIAENHEKDADEFVISQDSIGTVNDSYIAGVKLTINRNMDSLYHVKDPVSLLDFWRGSSMKNAEEYFRYDIMTQKTIKKGEYSGNLNKVVLQINKDDNMPLKIYELILAKENVLFFAYFQCPEKQFDYYQKIFDKAIESIKIK